MTGDQDRPFAAADEGAGDAPLPTVTLVIPTRNESPNIAVLVSRIAGAMDGVAAWEILFVDDSDDDTPAAVEAQRALGHPVRVHHRRPGHRRGGLSGAVEDGFAMAHSEFLAVMDADLQHPPEVLPGVLAPVLAGSVDLVAGTRYDRSGTAAGLDGRWRKMVSSGSRMLVHAVVPRSRQLTDPLSGLFAFRRGVIDGVDLQANGFKILLEVVARGRWTEAQNYAYTFDRRYAGTSKADLHEGLLFAHHLLRLLRVRRVRPAAAVVAPAAPNSPPRPVSP